MCGGGGGMDVVVGGEMVPDPGLPESSVCNTKLFSRTTFNQEKVEGKRMILKITVSPM